MGTPDIGAFEEVDMAFCWHLNGEHGLPNGCTLLPNVRSQLQAKLGLAG